MFQRPGVEPPVTTSPREIARNFFEGLGLVPPDGEIDLIKRVVGLPGETVAIDSGRVLIDGEPLDEPYAMPETRSFPATSVPPGHLFLMGDNRMDSDDSRFSLGPVPVGNVVGRAFVIVWPPSRVTARLDADYPSVGERPGGAHIDRPSRTRLSSHSGAVAQPRRAAAPAASPRANPRPRRRRLLTHEPH